MANQIDNRTIYEIFKACRLCGAGGGYKMPIIQNFVAFDSSDYNLQQKIRECVQIEVNLDDKMPPLICELCVDKVNDFYEFLEMCRQTNKKTRLRLGLPPQKTAREAPDADDCILGVTEPIYINDEDEPPPTLKPGPKSAKLKKIMKSEDSNKKDVQNIEKGQNRKDDSQKPEDTRKKLDSEKGKGKKDKGLRKELNNLLQSDFHSKVDGPRSSRSRETRLTIDSRSSSVTSSPPTRETRQRVAVDDNVTLGRLKQQEINKKSEKPKPAPPKSILKKDVKKEEDSDSDSSLPLRGKRTRDEEPSKGDVPNKKIKITIKLQKLPDTKSSPKEKPSKTPVKETKQPVKDTKSKNIKAPTKLPSLPANSCEICRISCKNASGLYGHMRLAHVVSFTNPMLSCNACGEWYTTEAEVTEHHNWHKTKNKPYHCRWCTTKYKQLAVYEAHFKKKPCVPYEEVPDVKCNRCSKAFPTKVLLSQHQCTGPVATFKCDHCDRTYMYAKNLKQHKKNCKARKNTPAVKAPATTVDSTKSDRPIKVDRKLRNRIKPLQVRVSRCDKLLRRRGKQEHYDVSNVQPEFGLDENCVYPYIASYCSLKIKDEPLDFDGMVSIKQDVKDEIYTEEDYVHWDSDLSSDSEIEDSVLTNTKIRKVDSLTALSLKTLFSKRCLGKVPRKLRKVKQEKLFDSLFDDRPYDISNIINNLGNDDGDYDSDSLLERDRSILTISFGSLLIDDGNDNHSQDSIDKKNNEISNDNHEYDTDASLDCKIDKTSKENGKKLNGEHVSEVAVEGKIENSVIDEENSQDSQESYTIDTASCIDINNDTNGDNSKIDDTRDNHETPELKEERNFVNNDSTNDSEANIQESYTDIDSFTDVNNKSKDDENKIDDAKDCNEESEATSIGNDVINNDAEDTQESDKTDIGNAANETKSGEDNDKIDETGDNSQESIADYEINNDTNDPDNLSNQSQEVNNKDIDINESNGQSQLNDINSYNSCKKSNLDLDDRRLMEELDAQIGESETNVQNESERNKMTLDDLVQNDQNSLLDNISDDEFNFDK